MIRGAAHRIAKAPVMTAPVLKMHTEPFARLVCSRCGATGASCNCGTPCLSVEQRVREAVAANPHRSSRAIATTIGVSHTTVDKVRKNSVGNHLPTEDNFPVEKRVGLDGKTRRMPTRKSHTL